MTMKTPQILLVDDDKAFSALTAEFLETKNLDVTLRHSGDDGLSAFRSNQFDLCIFDVKMPMKDGFTLAREIRQANNHVPIIFLTGQTEKSQRIEGFHAGADDYVTKPFSMEELHLRIAAILRRTVRQQDQASQEIATYEVGLYHFNPHSRELTLHGNLLKMTAIEARLLELFCQSKNGLIDRTTALRRIWSDDDLVRGRSLNVYVSKLRQYFREDPRIEILNVHGEGYRLVVRG